MDENYWILVKQGMVQYIMAEIAGKQQRVWPVAKTHADAVKLLAFLGHANITTAQIGTVEGETVEGHIMLAVKGNCAGSCFPQGWNKDGTPVWGWIPFD